VSGHPSSFKPALSPSSSLPVFQCTLCSSSRVSAVPARFGGSWCSCRCTSTQAYPRPNVNEAKKRPGDDQDRTATWRTWRETWRETWRPLRNRPDNTRWPTIRPTSSPEAPRLLCSTLLSSPHPTARLATSSLPLPPKSEYTHFEGPTPSLSYVHLRRRAATLTNPTGRHQPRPSTRHTRSTTTRASMSTTFQ
jgi:hypothetical protein